MDTTTYKIKLEEEREQLAQALQAVAVEDEHAEGGFAAREDDFSSEPASLDPVEVGTELESFTRNEAITNELEDRYHHVNEAIERIDKGTFGTCTECGKEIEVERLEANAAAQTCLQHMEQE